MVIHKWHDLGQLQQDSSTSLKPSSSQKKRILVVDDEVDITTVFRLCLEEADLQVDVYNDPLLALSDYKAGIWPIVAWYQNAKDERIWTI